MTDTEKTFSLEDFPHQDTFESSREYPALLVPVQRTSELRKRLQPVLLQLARTKVIFTSPDHPNLRIVVLNETGMKDPLVTELLNEDCQATTHTLKQTYDDYTVEEVLSRILPKGIEVPSSFEQVGCIAHVNLRDELLPYRLWIGKVLLDKNTTLKTVVNKVGTIANEYRTFQMQVLAGYAGPDWSSVAVKEEGCTFELDFQQVYWNSRLAGEHKRLVKHIALEAKSKPLVVADIMAGVGPFAVPLTSNKGNVTVYANDLNPASYKYLKINAQRNKCKQLHCYNQDARAFVHKLMQEGTHIDHVIMNLPKTAPEFLNAFQGWSLATLPCIHVHCFAPKADETNQTTIDRCAQALGCPLDRQEHNVSIKTVRNVAPNKNMLCVSFTLPAAVRDLPLVDLDNREPVCKRPKIS
jgi:tRNA (guanine37-N1)-methyltransferase